MDRFRLPGVDVVADCGRFPWPFRGDQFERVALDHSLQYLPFDRAVREISRICRDGALLEVIGPHFSSYNTFSDPGFRYALAWRTFDHYTGLPDFKYSYYAGDFRLEVVWRRISFRRCAGWTFNPWRWLGLEWLVNTWPRWYERFFAFLMPAEEICFTLKVHKGARAALLGPSA